MSRRIEITIDNEGETKVEAFGYVGGACMKATEPLKKALIGTPSAEVKKPEFFQHEVAPLLRERE